MTMTEEIFTARPERKWHVGPGLPDQDYKPTGVGLHVQHNAGDVQISGTLYLDWAEARELADAISDELPRFTPSH